ELAGGAERAVVVRRAGRHAHALGEPALVAGVDAEGAGVVGLVGAVARAGLRADADLAGVDRHARASGTLGGRVAAVAHPALGAGQADVGLDAGLAEARHRLPGDEVVVAAA